VYVVQQLLAWLREYPREGVRIFDAGTGGMEVMFHARGATRLVIVDASSTGSEPGTIYQVPGEELEADREPGYSLHDFRWDHALYAGRKIFREDFPQDVSVFLIEAASLDLGLSLSPPVRQAAEKVVGLLREMISSHASMPLSQPESLRITIARGNIYLPREVCDLYFPRSDSIALLRHEADLFLIPLVQQSAGGMLLKIRNLHGDRVVHAQEFLRAQGREETAEHFCLVCWNADRAALQISGIFLD
jgi:hydrogenase maturation protease